MRMQVFLVANLVLCVSLFAQQNRNQVWGGVEYNSHLKHSFNKTNGPGVSLKGIRAISQHFNGTVSLGYNYFKGDVKYWDGSWDNDFALVPLLLGVRYGLRKVFIGFEGGMVIKASSNASTIFAIAPSFGYRNKKFSSELRLLQVPGMPSFSENSFLKKGGYGFLGLRLSYQLL